MEGRQKDTRPSRPVLIMAPIRIFLITHRRPQLLRRSLGSLLAQTCKDWVCELHNDAPDDDAPWTILNDLAPGDPRLSYFKHSPTWGAVAVFNRVFRGGAEPFASMLEDDNWWEPEFLGTAMDALRRSPDAALSWANMRMWKEEPGGKWLDLGRAIWSGGPGNAGIVNFDQPELFQTFDALHSNGAMVFRPDRFRAQCVPSSAPLSIIEPLRERSASGPMLFIPRTLANFALTMNTARGRDPAAWIQARLLVAASFLQDRDVDAGDWRRMWAARRTLQPRDTGIFFLLAISLRRFRLVRGATAGDWLRFLLGAARHPLVTARGLRFRRDQSETWAWLVSQTAAAGGKSVRASLFSKCVPAMGTFPR